MHFKLFGKEPEKKTENPVLEFKSEYYDGRGKHKIKLRLEKDSLQVIDTEHGKPEGRWLDIPYLKIRAVEETPYSQLNTVLGLINSMPFGARWSTTDLFISVLFTDHENDDQYAVFKISGHFIKEHREALQAITETVAKHRP